MSNKSLSQWVVTMSFRLYFSTQNKGVGGNLVLWHRRDGSNCRKSVAVPERGGKELELKARYLRFIWVDQKIVG